jgi:two-component system chemotaxis response regulator CheY
VWAAIPALLAVKLDIGYRYRRKRAEGKLGEEFMDVLIIDDSSTIRMILRRFLGKMGCQVVEAENGREGLVRLREMKHADLVLVDWNMPEMNGLDFVRAVRAERAYDSLPVVMVTTNAQLENVSEALEAGADEYVMKPFTLDVIREKLGIIRFLKA